jgi:tight adherence protein B
MNLWPERWLGAPSLVLALLVLVSLLLLLEGLYLLWRSAYGVPARQRRQRLLALRRRTQAPSPLAARPAPSGPLGSWLQRLPMLERTQSALLQANLRWQAGPLLAMSVLAGLAGLGLLRLLHVPAGPAALAGLATGLAPWAYVWLRRQRRLHTLQRQLPEALDLMARAMRAGHAFASALHMAGQEMSEPMAAELRAVHEEVNFGLSLPQALAHLLERAPLTDLRYFVVAVSIQRESGGNLTEVLGKLAQLIRARLRLLDRVRVLSSEGRLSAWILVLMPFALAGLLALFNPTFMRPLWTDPMGITLLQAMLAVMLLGIVLIARIVRIRV